MSNRVEAASSRPLAAYSAAYLAASGVLAAVFAVISVAPAVFLLELLELLLLFLLDLLSSRVFSVLC